MQILAVVYLLLLCSLKFKRHKFRDKNILTETTKLKQDDNPYTSPGQTSVCPTILPSTHIHLTLADPDSSSSNRLIHSFLFRY